MHVHEGEAGEQQGYAHADTYICEAGHLTEASSNPTSGDRASGFHLRCRRVITHNYQGVDDVWDGRCGRSLIRTSLLPEGVDLPAGW